MHGLAFGKGEGAYFCIPTDGCQIRCSQPDLQMLKLMTMILERNIPSSELMDPSYSSKITELLDKRELGYGLFYLCSTIIALRAYHPMSSSSKNTSQRPTPYTLYR